MSKKKSNFRKEHLQRLICFAEHLAQCKSDGYGMEDYRGYKKAPIIVTQRGVSFICFPFIYQELPNAFENDWKFSSENGLIFLHCEEEYVLQYPEEQLIMGFFGLSTRETLSCFVPYVSKDFHLNSGSTPRDVSRCIFQLLGYTLPVANRTVLIEKVSLQNRKEEK
ncbi:MAG TPA: hypothetical protein VNW06_00590 [Cytophagaceae bacterium]|jgi:hypothetical protein|nr:hypothetical protein [Cytophagaceae bacterium]